ncbi:MAG: hypothetical protein WKG00_33105 [Polyangiaceae bacterium]
MKIDASALAADGFRYEQRRQEGGVDEVTLARSGGITGTYAQEAGAHRLDAASPVLEVVEAAWRVGDALVAVPRGAQLEQVSLQLGIASGGGGAETTLGLSISAAALPEVDYAGGKLRLLGRLEMEGLLVERGDDGATSLVAIKARAQGVRVRAGDAPEIEIDEVRIERLSVVSRGDALRVTCGAVEVDGLRASLGETRLACAKLAAPGGVTFVEGRITVAEAHLDGLEVEHAFPGPAPVPGTSAGEQTSDRPLVLPDIPALDLLSGHLNVDVRIDAAVPIIQHRDKTHHMRIGVAEGAISFADVEQGFGGVEDALLDFEVEGDELILELDVIPLVKFDNVTLVAWRLEDPRDRELAAQKRVRLRRLLQFRLPSRAAKKKSDRHDQGSVRLLGLGLENIDVQLALAGQVDVPLAGGTIHLGVGGRAVESLEVRGALRWHAAGDPQPGAIDVKLRGVEASLRRLVLGGTQLDGEVDVPGLAAHVEFVDLKPRRAVVGIGQLRLRQVTVDTSGAVDAAAPRPA